VNSLSALRGCQSTIDSGWSLALAPVLAIAVDAALAVPAPDGSPETISAQASACSRAGASCRMVTDDLDDVARNKLPAAWRGAVAETAGEAVSALSAESATASAVLIRAGQALAAWAGNLQTAQRNDRSGRAQLESAQRRLGPLRGAFSGFVEFFDPTDFLIAVEEARAGIASMVDATSRAQSSGQTTAGILNDLADQARAERVDADGLDPVDAVVLAAGQNASSDGGGDILTEAQLTRASQLMNGMSPAQLAEFDALLAGAKSPEEAAYLMKALAAGNSLAAIAAFDKLIHPYGNDPAWLSQHLAPDLAGDSYDNQDQVYWAPGQGWYDTLSQANVNDCAAASTVIAQANLDPVFMLKLTTGDQPGGAGSDSLQSFVNRLHQAYISQYQEGQRADGHTLVYPRLNGGLGSSAENVLANSDLGTATGTPYHLVRLNGSADNAAVLPQIEKAVDSGQPVPINVTDGKGDNHQMVIVGASGDHLEIYNPWGYTEYVTVQQFVSNQLGAATNMQSAMPRAYQVELPSS
jgi:hypothetical protein